MSDILDILNFLDSQITEAEVDEQLTRQRFLRSCQHTRFEQLEKAGLITHPAREEAKRQKERLALAQTAARMISEELIPLSEVAVRLGETRNTLTWLLDSTKTPYLTYAQQRAKKDDLFIADLQQQTAAGVSYRKACESHGRTTWFSNTILKRRGFKYVAKSNKVVKM